MPVGSEPGDAVALPHTWRPYGARIAGLGFGVLLLILCVAVWLAFPPHIRDRFTVFQRGTLVFLGLLGYAAWYALIRSRLTVADDSVTVVNGYRTRHYEWNEIIAISLRQGAPWASLDLSDGTSVSVMGVQGSDGSRATSAVRAFRSLLADKSRTDRDD